MPERSPANGPLPITASEVGRYVYCARSWWLQRVVGLAPRNLAALERGQQGHESHGRAVAGEQRMSAVVRWLLLIAVALILVLALSMVLKSR
jgi:hypothetical protein